MTKTDTTTQAAITTAVMATNIEFIKKDMLDVKITLKTMIDTQENKIDKLETKVDNLSRIVFTGVGLSLAISVLLKFFFR